MTHLLPKAAYGYIQSKAIYPTQEQALNIAKGYRDRKLPLDVLVVDFLNMTRQGEMDLDPARWPDPAAMNQQLHSMGITTLLSVWPHYSAGTQFYDMLRERLAHPHPRWKAGPGMDKGDRPEHRYHQSRGCQVVLGRDPRSLCEALRFRLPLAG